jgi:hypothetical protein
MDVVRDGFVRATALDRWRDIEGVRESLACTLAQAAAECADFPTRRTYRGLWEARWRDEVLPAARAEDPATLYAAIEAAVRAALADEVAARQRAGDRPLDEDPEYKRFVDTGLERLLAESAAAREPE